jgi:hypothetical protein
MGVINHNAVIATTFKETDFELVKNWIQTHQFKFQDPREGDLKPYMAMGLLTVITLLF